MEFEVFPRRAFQGGVFSAEIRHSFEEEFFRDMNCVTIKIIGTARMKNRKMRFLESVPVMLPIAAREATALFRCVIPDSAPPTVSFINCSISYVLQMEVYHSNEKSLRVRGFRVCQSGLCGEFNMRENVAIVHSDMIRTDLGDDTAFERIVERLRGSFRCGDAAVPEVVEKKEQLINESGFYTFMNDTVRRYSVENKGDIFCYISGGREPICRRTKKARIRTGEGEICLVEYEDVFLRKGELRLFYGGNVDWSKIFISIGLLINSRPYKQEDCLVADFVSSMCTYRCVDVDFERRDCFSFESSLFEISFSYRIVLDDREFLLPFTVLSPDGKFAFE
jgi:hypothetical protein